METQIMFSISWIIHKLKLGIKTALREFYKYLYSTYCLIICFYQGSIIPDIWSVIILDSNQQEYKSLRLKIQFFIQRTEIKPWHKLDRVRCVSTLELENCVILIQALNYS